MECDASSHRFFLFQPNRLRVYDARYRMCKIRLLIDPCYPCDPWLKESPPPQIRMKANMPENAQDRAAFTYNAAADFYDASPLSFWDYFGRRTIELASLPATSEQSNSLTSRSDKKSKKPTFLLFTMKTFQP